MADPSGLDWVLSACGFEFHSDGLGDALMTGDIALMDTLSYGHWQNSAYMGQVGYHESTIIAIPAQQSIEWLATAGLGKLVAAVRAGRIAEVVIDAEKIETGSHSVYQSVSKGIVQYVGRTNNFERRAAEHWLGRGIDIERIPGLSRLSRYDARAVEQVLIEHFGGAKGDQLMNAINSIAVTNGKYSQLLRRGAEILRAVRYPGF